MGQPDADDARDAGRHLFLWAVTKRHDEDVIARIMETTWSGDECFT